MDLSSRGWWGMTALILAVYLSMCQAEQCDPSDKKALLEFRAGFTGWYFDNWEIDTDCCFWKGITCDNAGRVTILSVYNPFSSQVPVPVAERNANYTGIVGETLGDLTELRTLELRMIMFNGPMPNTLDKLPNLLDIILAYNNFSGSLSPSIGGATSLWSLSVDGENYWWASSGLVPTAIPPTFCQLRNLLSLRLTSFSLTGQIPECFCKFNKMTYLELDGNNLEGKIPSCVGEGMQKLETLSLSVNRLDGSIPSTLGSLPALHTLSLSQNQLTGSIPPEIGNIASLQFIDVSNNYLSGPIPAEIGNLTELGFLDLSSNNLTRIPPELGKLMKIGSIRLSDNQLQGELPPEIGNAGNQSFGVYLDIANNQLSGSIPDSFGSGSFAYFFAANNLFTGGFPLTLTMVGKVDISDNRLSDVNPVGTLPPAPAIYYLGLRNNVFSGQFPSWLENLAASVNDLTEVDISVNKLTGPVPASVLKNLWNFNASHNQLDGELPKMRSSSRIGFLDLSYNNISGPITPNFIDNKLSGTVPPSVEKMVSLQFLDLSNNSFRGSVPSKNEITPSIISS
ncbi:hypothetical protein R1sor_017606 [Riccia sorocarpa]|uniref:Leucine-rich repeat-containing N-terminal plant-type domain-containing protein n=1 Tax=Riccia sorocarpa TaxID=122646 RepID=A0ABD3IAN1_9MARC